jgi:hypothetical protein
MNEKLFPIVVPNAAAERDDLAPRESKNVPQRLKPSSARTITARLNPCPSFDSLFPSLSGAVQIGQPKSLLKIPIDNPNPRADIDNVFSRPYGTRFQEARSANLEVHIYEVHIYLLETQKAYETFACPMNGDRQQKKGCLV